MNDGGEPAEHDELHTLLRQHGTDLDRIEAHRTGGGSRRRVVALTSINLFDTSTMCRTRSSTDMRN